jgi:hypothetical protein
MSKKQCPARDTIGRLAGNSVCTGFAFWIHFLSQTGTSCPLERGPNPLKLL